MEFFHWNKHKIVVKSTIHQKLSCLKSIVGKILKSLIKNDILNPESYCIPHRQRLLGKTTKQPLSNFEPRKSRKYKQLWGPRPDASCLLRKSSVLIKINLII